MLIAEYHTLLNGLIEEVVVLKKEEVEVSTKLVYSVMNMTGKWLKSRPDEQVACDEYMK